MLSLTNPSTIRQLMNKHGVRFTKSLGQNFIINPGICPRMAEEAGAGPGVGAIEIGPGVGALTAELAARCDKVVAIELDRRLLPLLAESLAPFPHVQILSADALEVDYAALLAREFSGQDVIVCANLPYYITTPIIMKLLESKLPLRSITVMVQREAARRISAPLPSRQSGAITVAVRYYAQPRVLFEVSPGSFFPPPDVVSAVLHLEILPQPSVQVENEDFFFRVVRAAFGQRRKTLLNALHAAFPLPKAEMAACLEEAGLSPTARAEQLEMQGFADAANHLWQRLGEKPGEA